MKTPAGNAKRHDLHEMLVIALLAMLTGGRTCVDMEDYGEAAEPWLRTFLTLKNGIPSHDTTRLRPPWMKLLPFQVPDSRDIGATPARPAECPASLGRRGEPRRPASNRHRFAGG